MRLRFFAVVLVLFFTTSGALGEDPSDSTNAEDGSPTIQNGSSTIPASSPAPLTTPGGSPTIQNGSSTIPASSPAPLTTPAPSTLKPIEFATVKMSNTVTYLDAKNVLQQAVQLNNQITSLTQQIEAMKKGLNPDNSPFYGQLDNITIAANAQNSQLQSYLSRLNSLSATQDQNDSKQKLYTQNFVCFAASSCVTEEPTTASPTTPGATTTPTPCVNTPLTATATEQHLTKTDLTGSCNYTITSETDLFIIKLNGTVTINGSGYVWIKETRTDKLYKYNETTSGVEVNVTSKADIIYSASAGSTVSFDIAFVEQNPCTLDCKAGGDDGAQCIISTSGQQYCQCTQCRYKGDMCTDPIDPCLSKQKKLCGESATSPFGQCYNSICTASCYACHCQVPDDSTGFPQKCTAPEPSDTTPFTTTNPSTEVCPSTVPPQALRRQWF